MKGDKHHQCHNQTKAGPGTGLIMLCLFWQMRVFWNYLIKKMYLVPLNWFSPIFWIYINGRSLLDATDYDPAVGLVDDGHDDGIAEIFQVQGCIGSIGGEIFTKGT